ncbi:MAG: type II secretion system F family protein [Simkaniaceae bacterium]|nr:type II secretion system F family protein [Simkaniaceae bacterium]
MTLFQYEAFDGFGRKRRGVLDAESLDDAKERLRRGKLLVAKLTIHKNRPREYTLSSALLLSLTRDLSTLLHADLPLYDSLLTLKEKYASTRASSLLASLCDGVKGGRTLSSLLATYPRIFNEVFLSVVRAGEESGSLGDAFDTLLSLLSRTQRLKKRLSSSMIYPAFLGLFCLIMVGALLFGLIPSMSELFEGRSLHPWTECVLAVSRFANEHMSGILFTGIAVFVVIFALGKSPPVRKAIRRRLLRVPVIKHIIREAVFNRFCLVASTLVGSGVPLLDALRLGRRTMNHPLFEEIIARAEARVIEGESFSRELMEHPLVPSLVVRMFGIGERSGDMAKMMGHVAAIYEESLERSLTRLTAYLQPAILLFLGLIVAVVLLAVLLPLTDVGSMM